MQNILIEGLEIQVVVGPNDPIRCPQKITLSHRHGVPGLMFLDTF